MPETGKSAEIVYLNGVDYLLLDGYLAVRISALREAFSSRFSVWKQEQRHELPTQGEDTRPCGHSVRDVPPDH